MVSLKASDEIDLLSIERKGGLLLPVLVVGVIITIYPIE
jgi:hypothetical protein